MLLKELFSIAVILDPQKTPFALPLPSNDASRLIE